MHFTKFDTTTKLHTIQELRAGEWIHVRAFSTIPAAERYLDTLERRAPNRRYRLIHL